jgi:2',3'-cyclic-nucleotide 2'-phosphodiesterase (5'-nucleotidase family)
VPGGRCDLAPGRRYDILGLSTVPGIDVIVGGHSHTTLPATQVNGKIIIQAGEFGRLVGERRIDVDAATGVTLIDHRFMSSTVTSGTIRR